MTSGQNPACSIPFPSCCTNFGDVSGYVGSPDTKPVAKASISFKRPVEKKGGITSSAFVQCLLFLADSCSDYSWQVIGLQAVLLETVSLSH